MRFSKEHYIRSKPENHSSSGQSISCDDQSLAVEGSPLWNFEQKYGKVVNEVTWELNAEGRMEQHVVKRICKKSNKTKINSKCCVLRYYL